MADTATLSTLGPLPVCPSPGSYVFMASWTPRSSQLTMSKGREPYPGGSIYCATKAAVRSFTESLRKELIASRVRVIGVDPGQVETVGHIALHPLQIASTKPHLELLRRPFLR